MYSQKGKHLHMFPCSIIMVCNCLNQESGRYHASLCPLYIHLLITFHMWLLWLKICDHITYLNTWNKIPIIVSGSEPTHIIHTRTYSFDMFYNKDSTRVMFCKEYICNINTSLKEPMWVIMPWYISISTQSCRSLHSLQSLSTPKK